MNKSMKINKRIFGKKVLCILLTVSLCLMMIPHYLFAQRLQANAQVTESGAPDLSNNHFGEFNYQVNTNGNIVKYSNKQIFEKITNKIENQESVELSAKAAINKALVEAQVGYSGDLSKTISIPSYLPTSITSITSDLSYIQATQQAAEPGVWVFDIADPGLPTASGKLSITPVFASYTASYEVEAVKAATYTFDYPSAQGSIVVTPITSSTDKPIDTINDTAGTNDTNGVPAVSTVKSTARVDAQVKVKTVTPNANGVIEYGVNVTRNADNNGNNEEESLIEDVDLPNEEYFIDASVSKDLSYGDDASFSKEDFMTEEGQTADLKITDIELASTDKDVELKKIGGTGDYVGYQLKFKDLFESGEKIGITYTYSDGDTEEETITKNVILTKGVNPINLGEFNIQDILNEVDGALKARTKTEQLNHIKNKLESEAKNRNWKTLENNPIVLSVDMNNLFKSDQSYDLWNGTSSIDLQLKAFTCVVNGVPTSFYKPTYENPEISVSAPETDNESAKYFDASYEMDSSQQDYDVYVYGSDSIKIQANGTYTASNQTDEADPSEWSSEQIKPHLENVSTEGNKMSLKAFLKGNDSVVKKINKTIVMFDKNWYEGYTLPDTKEGESATGIIDQIINFFFSKEDVKMTINHSELVNGVLLGAHMINPPQESEFDSGQIEFIFSGNKDFEVDLSDASIQPKIKNPGTEDIVVLERQELTKKLTKDGDTTRIVHNAPKMEEQKIEWTHLNEEGVEVSGESPQELSDKAQTLKVQIKMPKDASHLFEYTRQASKDPTAGGNRIFAEYKSAKHPTPRKITYNDVNNGFKYNEKNDTWEASVQIDPLELGGRNEDNYFVTVYPIIDVLGRTAANVDSVDSIPYTFGVDHVQPNINVKWTPDKPSNTYTTAGRNTDYYKQTRTAEITIDDLNFDATCPSIDKTFIAQNLDPTEATKTDKITISEWTKSRILADGKSCDQYKATITISDEGDCKIDIDCHDLVTNEKGQYIHQADHYDSKWFCIDWTNPTLSVTWDNNNVVNGKYYTAARTATLVLNERNFASEYFPVNPIVTTGHDGTVGSAGFSGWSHSGTHTYTATVNFPSEGTYALTVDGKDLALNALSPYAQPEFVIDWTAPNIQISNVQDHQAYNDVIQPVVTINDANMSPETTCQVNNLGITKGNPFQTSPAASDAQYTYSYSNPEKVPDNDGVYRVNVNAVDMAGNSSQQTLVWSVNRFGSTYVIDAETDKMLNNYVNDSTKQDVKVVEINPSGLESSKIDEKKGSFTSTLTEGQDFTTNSSGGGDSWFERQYTIDKNHFIEDNDYTLYFSSKDTAGNENENTMDNKNPEHNAKVDIRFTLDNAKPTCYYDNLSQEIYGEAKHDAAVVLEDNTNAFSEATVSIDGEEEYYDGDKIKDIENKVNMTLNESSAPHTIEVTATDKAGNTMDKSIKKVVVSSNPLVQWFYNTPLFIGTLVGVGLVAAAIVAYVIYRNKKKGEEK